MEIIGTALKDAIHLNKPLLICSDINARHEDWSDTTSNYAGKYFSTLFHSLAISTLNSRFIPGISTHPSTKSIIDIVATTHPDIISNIQTNLAHSLSSDHIPIWASLTCKQSSSAPATKVPHISWRITPQTDWNLFASFLTSLMDKFLLKHHAYLVSNTTASQETMDHIWSDFKDCIHLAANICLGKKKVQPTSRNWWSNSTVQSAYSLLTAARSTFLSSRSKEALSSLRESKSNFRLACKNAKRASWDHLCNGIARNSKLYWSYYKRTNPSQVFPLNSIPDKNNMLPTTIKQSLDNLGSHFRSTCTSATQSDAETEQDVKDLLDSTFIHNTSKFDYDIKPGEVEFEIKKLCPSTSLGPDLIPTLSKKWWPRLSSLPHSPSCLLLSQLTSPL
jgi:hypothetical protein